MSLNIMDNSEEVEVIYGPVAASCVAVRFDLTGAYSDKIVDFTRWELKGEEDVCE